MRSLLALLFVAILASVSLAAKPNVIVLLTDDQGWGDLSLHGNTNLKTPNMDRLARDGAQFDRFFVQPVCSPTRAEFLTGRWHPRGGVRGVSTGEERLNLDEKTIAECFAAAGYATGCFGKWHNGSQYPYHPNGRGFQEYYGFTSGHWGDYFSPPLDHNGQAITGEGYLTDDLTTRAMSFLKASTAAGKPSFIYVAYNTPHSPMQVPDEYWSRFEKKPLKQLGEKKEDLGHTRAAMAMCENLDDNLGRLMSFLKEQNLEQETIVVFFCDNGPNGPRWNGGMKGRKGSTDEGGVRSPLFIRWPGQIPADTVVKPIAGAIDLLPTLLELAAIPRVGQKPLDGISLAPWLLGRNPANPDRVLFSHWNGKTSARSQQYRLDANGQLFDLIADPGQTKPITAMMPQRAEQMKQAVAEWKKEVFAGQGGERPFTVGYPQFPRTVLPARDGVPRGQIKRSAPAPNCSFFTNWTQPTDQMVWPVKVETAGRYEAILHYTCAETDVGSEIELRLGQAAFRGKITTAHNPPLRGLENDRVKRAGESYVKAFKPLSLGVVALQAGEQELILQATKISGGSVADVRAIDLILQP